MKSCHRMGLYIILILAVVVGAYSSAVAIDEVAPQPAKTVAQKAPAKLTPPKIVRMRATGKVMDISSGSIKIERKIKDTSEVMEFVLDKPVSGVQIGDSVNVSYITKDGGNIALRISPVKKYSIKPQKNSHPKSYDKTPPRALETAPAK